MQKKSWMVRFSVGWAVTRSSLEREVGSSNLGLVKSDAVLPTACHCSNISSKVAVLHGRNDAEISPATCYTFRPNATSIIKNLIWQPTCPVVDFSCLVLVFSMLAYCWNFAYFSPYLFLRVCQWGLWWNILVVQHRLCLLFGLQQYNRARWNDAIITSVLNH